MERKEYLCEFEAIKTLLSKEEHGVLELYYV
ncbi:hypothetical protein T09_15769 [Trichinella sp. T9]|nr:hypothetical protein T09_15769 [Trichinella sp. T9]